MLTLNLSRLAQPLKLTVTGTERALLTRISPMTTGKDVDTVGRQAPLVEMLSPSSWATVAVLFPVLLRVIVQMRLPPIVPLFVEMADLRVVVFVCMFAVTAVGPFMATMAAALVGLLIGPGPLVRVQFLKA